MDRKVNPVIIPISGVIGWDVTGQQVRDALAAADGSPVEIQLSSVGGFVFDGLEIFNLIKNYDGEKTARLMGVAASMGSYIPLACDKIIAEANAVMMIHNAWGMGIGTAEDLRAEATVLEGLSSIICAAYVAKTGKTMEECQAMMDAETWMFGQEMVDAGFVDEMVGTPDKSAKAEAVKTARAALAEAKKIVSEYEGGDSPRRVAALVDLMKPKERKAVVDVPAVKPAKTENKGGSKIMTVDQLKAESPEVYAQVLALGRTEGNADGIKAERDRVAAINAFAQNGPAAKKVADEAIAQGKSFSDAMPELVAASARGPSTQENAPTVRTAAAIAAGLDDEDMQAAALFGMTLDEYKKGVAMAPKKEA